MEKRQIHGVASLFIISLSVLIGFYALAKESDAYALTYAGIVLAGSLLIIYSFCAKCPCKRDSCGHLIAGKMACALPPRKTEKYSSAEIIITVVSIGAIMFFPMPILLKEPYLLAAYLLMLLPGILELRFCVCPGCGNINCPVNLKK
jgi:hypothetical protein